jgi:hypothetical protein
MDSGLTEFGRTTAAVAGSDVLNQPAHIGKGLSVDEPDIAARRHEFSPAPILRQRKCAGAL